MKIKNIIFIPILLSMIGCTSNNNSETTLTTWEVKLMYNYEGNNSIFDTYQVEHNTKIKLNSEKQIERTGYLFTGWYRDSYCKIEWDFSKDKVSAPTTLYAGWEINSNNQQETTYNINWTQTAGVNYKALEGSLPTKATSNTNISFMIEIATGYIGNPIVKVNNQVIKATDNVYNFIVTSDINVTVFGVEKENKDDVIEDYYRITFTLPNFSPAATNPRLYYWGSETTSDSLFNLGATSNMTKLEGNTYYIDLESTLSIEGLIIIFDQGNEVKQSFDIKDNLPTEVGTYHINVPDWTSTGWKQNDYGVWCFVATLEKR